MRQTKSGLSTSNTWYFTPSWRSFDFLSKDSRTALVFNYLHGRMKKKPLKNLIILNLFLKISIIQIKVVNTNLKNTKTSKISKAFLNQIFEKKLFTPHPQMWFQLINVKLMYLKCFK